MLELVEQPAAAAAGRALSEPGVGGGVRSAVSADADADAAIDPQVERLHALAMAADPGSGRRMFAPARSKLGDDFTGYDVFFTAMMVLAAGILVLVISSLGFLAYALTIGHTQ